MSEFKGFDDWVEIFRGGKQTDSVGRVHDGSALLDRAIATFNAVKHEPPAVIGHPTTDSPAYGWVVGLKKEGDRLLAKFKDVVPEFGEMVKRGMYKKRSAAFYPDGRLRHVGFLGAAAPAVKGLADLKFEAGDNAITFEFGEEAGLLARIFRRLRDALIADKGQDAADSMISNWEIEELQNMANRPQEAMASGFSESTASTTSTKSTMSKEKETMPTFTEADLETAKKEAAATARKQVEAEFAEARKKEQDTARRAEIKQFCAAGVRDGKLAPAWIDAGLPEFMESLPAEEPIEFGEAGKAGKKTPHVWFVEFLASLPKVVEFKEIAGRGSDVAGGSASEKLTALVKKKLEAKPGLSYSAAFSEVQIDHPELAAEYAADLGQ